jgi:hypothetical protein
MGATINQSWNPPMCGQDEMDDVMVETYSNNIKRTFCAIAMHGCMLMNDEYGSGGDEMTDTWVCFGDPSIYVRTAMPLTMTVTHNPVIFLGTTTFNVNCNQEGARATLTMDGTMLATTTVTGGVATLQYAPINTPGTATLTVTGFNCLPYTASIDVIPAEGPFVVFGTFDINDPDGNNNGLADYSESVDLSVGLDNVGIQDAIDVTVTISTTDPYVTITDPTEVYPLIPANGSATIENGFGIDIASNVPDQHAVTFNLNSSDGDQSWQSTFIINANAPILNINSLTISDVTGGNGDGELDPGEQVEMTINYSNTGHAIAYNVDVYLEGQSGFTEVLDPNQNFENIGFLGVFNKTFNVTIDADAPEGIMVNFQNELTMGDMLMTSDFIRKISAKCEDFETGDLTKFNWQTGGNLPWGITNQFVYEGNYCVKSGAITHNQSSEISLTYEVMNADSIIFFRKVSSEPSDQLRFFINNVLMDQWSGTTGGWKRQAYAVTPGMKTFKWIYQKSATGTSGSDCAWIDFIVLPPPMVLTIWAGPNDDVCNGSTFQLMESYGTDYVSIDWNTTGTGTFSDNTVMHPVYTPGQEDLMTGNVTLSLVLTNDQGTSVQDDMELSFTDVPEAPATPQGPVQVDPAVTPITDYSTQETGTADHYAWHLQPAEAGSIAGIGTTATVSWNPDYVGAAFITVAGVNDCGEGILSSALEVTVDVVGINDPTIAAMTVYPNPVTSTLNMRMVSGVNGPVNVRIFNILGEKILEANYGAQSAGQLITLDLSALPQGMYILSVSGNQLHYEQKLIVR